MKFKARTIKRGTEGPGAHRGARSTRRSPTMAKLIRAADFTPAVLNRAIGILQDIDRQMYVPESTIRQDTNTLKKEKNPTRIDFYKRRIAEIPQVRCASSSRSSASRTRTSRRPCGWSARAKRKPTRPSTS